MASTANPECPYCGATDGLRIKCDGGMSAFGFQIQPTEYTCEGCFIGTDDGPSFDDLPEVPENFFDELGVMPAGQNPA